ncbi:MAG TPA: hypothetical protein VK988_13195 [Acidimicrobiales bacterium]|nr:hypothetical protein [Acidimicrobiales bacterium]
MQQPRLNASNKNKPVSTLVGELWQLFVGYLKQETIVPVKDLGRFLAKGLAGSLLLSVGLVLLMLAGLRALQSETGSALDGNWSFVPYLIIFVVAAIIAGLAVRAIASHKRRATRKGSLKG